MLYERYYNLLWFQNCYCSFTWHLWTFHIAIELVRSFRELFLTHVFTFVYFFLLIVGRKKRFQAFALHFLTIVRVPTYPKWSKRYLLAFPQKSCILWHLFGKYMCVVGNWYYCVCHFRVWSCVCLCLRSRSYGLPKHYVFDLFVCVCVREYIHAFSLLLVVSF